ncbi:MAG: hypothetical protein K2O16_00745, partial [Lachnospiraceae bacterium]|nr:hypothetical protein [Lachnospiraceae bacterium]
MQTGFTLKIKALGRGDAELETASALPRAQRKAWLCADRIYSEDKRPLEGEMRNWKQHRPFQEPREKPGCVQ